MAVFGLALAIAPAPRARADEVRLTNGDIIHGELIGGDGRAIRFKAALVKGEVTIEHAQIASLVTDGPIDLKMLDGTRLRGKAGPGARPGHVLIRSESLGPIAVDLERVSAINEVPETAAWTGKIAIGATVIDGNTQSKTFFGSFDAERLSKYHRIEAHAYYAYGETHQARQGDEPSGKDVLSTKKGFSRIQYSYYVLRAFSLPLYLYAGMGMEYDRFQNLALRSRGGGGAGWAIAETEKLIARVEVGSEFVNEDYRRNVADRDFVTLRESLKLEWQATDWLRLVEFIEVSHDTENMKDFFLRSQTGVNVALWKGFGIAFITIWEHDQVPASPDRERNDETYTLTFTYVF